MKNVDSVTHRSNCTLHMLSMDNTLVHNQHFLKMFSKVFFLSHYLSLYHTIPTLNDPREESFRKHCGKGENAGYQHFLLFKQSILPFSKKF